MSELKTMGEIWAVLDRYEIPRICAHPNEHDLPTAKAILALENRNKTVSFALNDLIQAVSKIEADENLAEALLQANLILGDHN